MRASAHLASLLADIRQHPTFPELLKLLEPEPMPRYAPGKDGGDIAKVGATLIYRSGLWQQYDRTLAVLTGNASPQGEK